LWRTFVVSSVECVAMREFPGFSLHVLACWSGECPLAPRVWPVRRLPDAYPFAVARATSRPSA
jgi:hypothetical protein